MVEEWGAQLVNRKENMTCQGERQRAQHAALWGGHSRTAGRTSIKSQEVHVMETHEGSMN